MNTSGSSLGEQLEMNGWLQGSIISGNCAIETLKQCRVIDLDVSRLVKDEFILIVASQSCYIARSDDESSIQLVVASIIDKTDGNKEFNKNPRFIHCTGRTVIGSEESAKIEEIYFEIKVVEKLFIKKKHLINTSIDHDISITEQDRRSFVNWLGGHYTKPALPTAFNDIINGIESKPYRRAEKALGAEFRGVYVSLEPKGEIDKANEIYKVQLLGLVFNESDEKAGSPKLEKLATLMKSVGLDVTVACLSPKKVSIDLLDRFTRIYLDDISYKQQVSLPPDVNPRID
ncbi:hypothetical protein [Aliivibrio kagoshimensis]|uniref:hypothetical protein n=1 Tax=Aliivibrio kagoshimensis TaxID=2910230 RepID=UPI003D0D1D69